MPVYGHDDPWQKFHTPPLGLNRKKRRFSGLGRLVILLVAGGVVWGGIHFFPDLAHLSKKLVAFFRHRPLVSRTTPPPETASQEKVTASHAITLVTPLFLKQRGKTVFTTTLEQSTVTVETGLVPHLQAYFQHEVDHLKTLTRAKPEVIAMVAMDPETGQILALAGFSPEKAGPGVAMTTPYPAASIFKIITACAALESGGITPDSSLHFNGGKYTLYKRQLRRKKNRYTTTVSFKDAFAQSINPVFGKLGAHTLGGKRLTVYGQRFGFQRSLGRDFPAVPGMLTLTEEPYQWAEVGCGFNKTTTITPLFGAVITATLVNQGVVPAPYLIKSVNSEQGTPLYRHRPEPALHTAVTEKTANTMVKMMQRTITRGTARKAFRGHKQDRILSRLILGGKTGSLFNQGPHHQTGLVLRLCPG